MSQVDFSEFQDELRLVRTVRGHALGLQFTFIPCCSPPGRWQGGLGQADMPVRLSVRNITLRLCLWEDTCTSIVS